MHRSQSLGKAVIACAVMLILLLAISQLGCSPEQTTTQPEKTTTQVLTSAEIINRAYELQEIDFDSRALYLTYSIYKPEALPSVYQSTAPVKDATPVILEIQRDWDKLSPETQQKISPYIQPPGKEGEAFVTPAGRLPSQLGEVEKGSSVELIEKAYELQEIDFDSRSLYLTYSIYKPEALPSVYQSTVPVKDATPVILKIQRDWDKLSLETQQKISPYIQPLDRE